MQPRYYRSTTISGDKRTDQGWLCLAVVLDLAPRMIIGWQMATHVRTSFKTDALEMARLYGHVALGATFHSGRGAQYTSGEFVKYLRMIKNHCQRRQD